MQLRRRLSVACVLGLAFYCAMHPRWNRSEVELNSKQQEVLVGGITWNGQCALGTSTCTKCVSQTCDPFWQGIIVNGVWVPSSVTGCNLSAAPAGGCTTSGVLSNCITGDWSCNNAALTMCGGGSIPGPVAPGSCIQLFDYATGEYQNACSSGGTQSCMPTTGYAPCKSCG